MINPLDDLNFSRSNKHLDELEKLAGISKPAKKKDIIDQVAGNIAKKSDSKKIVSNNIEDKHWKAHKVFTELYECHGKPFAMFVGDLLDIVLSGPVQARLVNEMIEDKINRMRKAKEANTEKPQRKVNVPAKRSTKFDVSIGGEKRLFSRHFLKRKGFLAAIFLDSEEYPAYKKLIKQIETVCHEETEGELPKTECDRMQALKEIVNDLRYEITRDHVTKAWVLLEADYFKNLEWIFLETKNYHLVRPNFYEDLDKAYRDGKKLLKLLINDVKNDFPPHIDKQDAFEDYLKNILEVYTHHHFVLKYFHHTRPTVSLKDFELTKEEMQEKIEELREEQKELRQSLNTAIVERDQMSAEARILKNNNEELKRQLKNLDPVEVKKQLQAAQVSVNAANRELNAAVEGHTELRTDMRKLDEENQELTRTLQQLKAIPDENAYSVVGLLENKRVAIFGGVGKDHYWPILKEAGVKDNDYEWHEGYHTISQSRTSEIVGRCDLVVVVTSYAGHLLLYQVRPCIKPNQHFFKIHNSGAGSLRKEIIQTFKK